MIDFRNIKASECCCGCTLRQGTLILLWLFLIGDSFGSLFYLTGLLYGDKSYGHVVGVLHSSYYLIWSICGITSSLFGIYAIQKNIPKHLTYTIYYIYYYAAYTFLLILLIIFFPNTYSHLIWSDTFIGYRSVRTGEMTLVLALLYLFLTALTLYFAVIVRSYRDKMLEDQASNSKRDIVAPTDFGHNVA